MPDYKYRNISLKPMAYGKLEVLRRSLGLRSMPEVIDYLLEEHAKLEQQNTEPEKVSA